MEGSNGVISFEESGLQFEFYTDTIKYDDREFYKKTVINLQGMKAVDFISLIEGYNNRKSICFMEVKNFTLADKSVLERMDPRSDNALHIEIAQKVRDTIAGLFGAKSLAHKEIVEELLPYAESIAHVERYNNNILVIAFVEGNLSRYKNGHADGLVGLQRSLEKSLKWLNCTVFALDVNAKNKCNEMEWFVVK